MKHIITAIAFCAAGTASAMSGNTLLARMNGNSSEQMNAYGYVTGVGDALQSAGFLCYPKDVTVSQVHDIVKRALESKPELRHIEASDLMFGALLGFACPKTKAKLPSL